jgi:hypothetical protein
VGEARDILLKCLDKLILHKDSLVGRSVSLEPLERFQGKRVRFPARDARKNKD